VVSDTNFATRTTLQLKGRGGLFKSSLKFVVEGAEADMNEIVKQLGKNANEKNRFKPMKSRLDVSGSVNMMDFRFDLMRPSFLPDSSFSSRLSVDSTSSMNVDDEGFLPWRRDVSPLLLLTSGPNPH
jgi:hypothetical protein